MHCSRCPPSPTLPARKCHFPARYAVTRGEIVIHSFSNMGSNITGSRSPSLPSVLMSTALKLPADSKSNSHRFTGSIAGESISPPPEGPYQASPAIAPRTLRRSHPAAAPSPPMGALTARFSSISQRVARSFAVERIPAPSAVLPQASTALAWPNATSWNSSSWRLLWAQIRIHSALQPIPAPSVGVPKASPAVAFPSATFADSRTRYIPRIQIANR